MSQGEFTMCSSSLFSTLWLRSHLTPAEVWRMVTPQARPASTPPLSNQTLPYSHLDTRVHTKLGFGTNRFRAESMSRWKNNLSGPNEIIRSRDFFLCPGRKNKLSGPVHNCASPCFTEIGTACRNATGCLLFEPVIRKN